MAPRLAVRSNLPAETSSFVGRRAELVQARRMLGNLRLVTVTGPGGVGKTRLALRVAARARRAFPDGGHLVDLTRLQQPGLLGDTVLQVLGMVDLSSRPAAAVLAERLSGLRLLLVLDNCEHLIDACADLVHLLLRATPDVHVLATSREPLRLPGESVLEVAPVPADDAMALFEARGRAVLPGFAISSDNRDIVAELCQRLDRLPLAVELAAAWLRVLSAAQIWTGWATGSGCWRRRDGPGGTSRCRPQWTGARNCSAPERALWARASVFAGDFDLNGAQRVCADDETGPAASCCRCSAISSTSRSSRPGPAIRRFATSGWTPCARTGCGCSPNAAKNARCAAGIVTGAWP